MSKRNFLGMLADAGRREPWFDCAAGAAEESP